MTGGGSMLRRSFPSGPALAARGCWRICKEQRFVILLDEISDAGREKLDMGPGNGKDAVVLVGVDALDVDLRMPCVGNVFKAFGFRGAIDAGVRMLSGGSCLASLVDGRLQCSLLTHGRFLEARGVASVVLMVH